MNQSVKQIALFFIMGCFFFQLDAIALKKNSINDLQTMPTFESLQELEKYASALPETPSADNYDWKNPTFESFYEARKKFMSRWNRQSWTPTAFKKLIEHVTTIQHQKEYTGRFVIALEPEPFSNFVIISNITSSFHALVRYLRKLNTLDLIDEHLIFTKPNTYLIFNGISIADGIYVIDTLTLILELMVRNPDKIIIIKGAEADKGKWQTQNIKDELNTCCKKYTQLNEQLPFESLIGMFIDSAALALYLISKPTITDIELVRISSYGQENKELQEKKFEERFAKLGTTIIDLEKDYPPATIPAKLKIIIVGQPPEAATAFNGLAKTGTLKEGSGFIFNALSGNSGISRINYKFFYDAFLILTTAQAMKDWTLTLYNDDLRKQSGIHESQKFNLETGIEFMSEQVLKNKKGALELDQKIAQLTLETIEKEPAAKILAAKVEVVEPVKAEAQEIINVATTIDLSKSEQYIGNLTKNVLENYFSDLNEQKVLKNTIIKYAALDDRYEAAEAQKNIDRFINEFKTNIIISPIGSHTLASYINRVKKGELIVLFPITASPETFVPDLKNIIHYGTSGLEQGQLMANTAIQKFNANNIAIFYMSTLKDVFDGVVPIFENAHKKWIGVPHTPADTTLTVQSRAIKDANPDALMLITTPQSTTALIRQLGSDFFIGKPVLGGIAYLNIESLKTFLQEKGIVYAFPCHTPNPATSELPIVVNFREFAQRHGIKEDPSALQAYISARMFTEILKKIDGPVTNEKIIEAAQQFNNFDLGGISLTFDPQTRRLVNMLWIDIYGKPWEAVEIPPKKGPK